jgi:hypothetical protein
MVCDVTLERLVVSRSGGTLFLKDIQLPFVPFIGMRLTAVETGENNVMDYSMVLQDVEWNMSEKRFYSELAVDDRGEESTPVDEYEECGWRIA